MTDATPLWLPPGVDPRDWWGHLAGQLGAGPGYPLARPFLLVLRGVVVGAAETHETVARAAYDDTFVGLSHDGVVPPYVFRGASHAYQRDSRAAPDVNGDGRGDVGCIRPGRFELTLAITDPFPIFTLTMPGGSGNIPCFRDTNHDGRYSAAELSQRSFATAVLLHTGFDAPAGSEHRSSIACQTANVADLRYLASHAAAYGRKIDYVLLDADDALALLVNSPFRKPAAGGANA